MNGWMVFKLPNYGVAFHRRLHFRQTPLSICGLGLYTRPGLLFNSPLLDAVTTNRKKGLLDTYQISTQMCEWCQWSLSQISSMSFKMHTSILYPRLFSQLLVRLMTAISLERWSHYQRSDRWRRKMLHLRWCDRPSVWPIFGGFSSDGEGAGGYFCLIGFNNVETVWIIGTCWHLVVILQCNAGRSFITKVDTLQALQWRSTESNSCMKGKKQIHNHQMSPFQKSRN